MHPLDESLAQVRDLSPYLQIHTTDIRCGVTIADLCDMDGMAWQRLMAVQQRELGDTSLSLRIGAVLQSYVWPVLSGPITCFVLCQRVPVLDPQETTVQIINDYPELLGLQSRRFFCVACDKSADHEDAMIVQNRDELRNMLRQQITAHFAPLIDTVSQRTGLSASSLWVRVADASAGVVVRILDMIGGMPPEIIQQEAQLLVMNRDALLFCRRVEITIIPHVPCDRVFHNRVSCCYWYKRPVGGVCMTCPHRRSAERIAVLTAYVAETAEVK